jgi:chemotaxis family two-component system response regulator Rcp1
MIEDTTSQRVVLVVDDNPDHVCRIEAAFRDQSVNVVAIATAQQALAYLKRQEPYQWAPRPALILLELNLSDQSGREMLITIKTDANLRRIPTVVLTLSDQTQDIYQSYAAQGNCYVIKVTEQDRLTQIIERIKTFWLGIVTLPAE